MCALVIFNCTGEKVVKIGQQETMILHIAKIEVAHYFGTQYIY